MAALHFLAGRKMHPTISHEFKISLPPSLPSFCSFPLFPSKCQSTTVAGLNIIKCFHQQNKWSKGSGGIPPTPTPSQLTNIEAYKRSFSLDDDIDDEDLEDEPKRPKLGHQIRDPKDGRPDIKRQKRKVDHHHLSNSVNIGLEIMGDGDYAMKIKRRSSTGGSSSTHDEEGDEVEKAKQMAQNAAMLMLHGELLQDMGKKLLAQTQASLHSIYGIGMPAAPPSDLQSD